MKTRLRQAWQARAPRERIVITVVAVIIGVTLYGWLLQSGGRARSEMKAKVTMLRAEAAGLEQQALELERLRATPATPASRTDLGAQVQRQAEAAGLAGAVARLEVQDANQVAVTFGAVAFADWLRWIASLDSQQVRLSACRIEALAEPGMVGVTATLQRAK